jgi:hypothetical protein
LYLEMRVLEKSQSLKKVKTAPPKRVSKSQKVCLGWYFKKFEIWKRRKICFFCSILKINITVHVFKSFYKHYILNAHFETANLNRLLITQHIGRSLWKHNQGNEIYWKYIYIYICMNWHGRARNLKSLW